MTTECPLHHEKTERFGATKAAMTKAEGMIVEIVDRRLLAAAIRARRIVENAAEIEVWTVVWSVGGTRMGGEVGVAVMNRMISTTTGRMMTCMIVGDTVDAVEMTIGTILETKDPG